MWSSRNVLWIRNCRQKCWRPPGGCSGRRADATCAITRWQHFSAWNNDVSAILNVWHQSRNTTPGLHQSVHIYLKNNPAKFHPDQIWDVRTLEVFKGSCAIKNKMSSDTTSVPDLKILTRWSIHANDIAQVPGDTKPGVETAPTCHTVTAGSQHSAPLSNTIFSQFIGTLPSHSPTPPPCAWPR